jgi:hypothetical protein
VHLLQQAGPAAQDGSPGEPQARALRERGLEVLPGRYLRVEAASTVQVIFRGHQVNDRALRALADGRDQARVLRRGPEALDRHRPVSGAVIQQLSHLSQGPLVGGQISADGIAGLRRRQCPAGQALVTKDRAEIRGQQFIHRVPGEHELPVTRPGQRRIFRRKLSAAGGRGEFGEALPLGLQSPLKDVADDNPVDL